LQNNKTARMEIIKKWGNILVGTYKQNHRFHLQISFYIKGGISMNLTPLCSFETKPKN